MEIRLQPTQNYNISKYSVCRSERHVKPNNGGGTVITVNRQLSFIHMPSPNHKNVEFTSIILNTQQTFAIIAIYSLSSFCAPNDARPCHASDIDWSSGHAFWRH